MSLAEDANALLHLYAYDDPGIMAIGRERRRVLDHVDAETGQLDRTVEHDVAEHTEGEFVDAAVCYLLGHGRDDVASVLDVPLRWPWDAEDYAPGNTGDPLADRRRDLVRAGQLIAAALARMDAAAYRLPLGDSADHG